MHMWVRSKKNITIIILCVIAFCFVLGFGANVLHNSGKNQNSVENSDLNLDNSDEDSSFENEYETATRRCIVLGCNNPVAPGGESDYCPAHSNKCLRCGKYISRPLGCCSSCAEDILDEMSDDDNGYYNYNYDKHKNYNYNYDKNDYDSPSYYDYNYDDNDYYNYDYDDYDDYDYEYDEYDYDDYYDF